MGTHTAAIFLGVSILKIGGYICVKNERDLIL